MRSIHCLVIGCAIAVSLPAGAGAGAQEAEEAQEAACPEPGVHPVLNIGDFNGDGVVDGADLKELASRIERRDNVAFFDMNADGRVDCQDLLIVAGQVGQRSAPVEQELAAVFRATERYRDQNAAIADGYAPVTQSAVGHGIHWGRLVDLDRDFELTQPEGLNYSEDGRLLAVFYAYGPIELDTCDAPPAGFSGPDPWHYHTGACFRGVDMDHPTYDVHKIEFEECVPQTECNAKNWIRKFYMIHAWLYEQNPCGVFALENPRVTTGVDPETAATRCADHGGHARHARRTVPGLDPGLACSDDAAGGALQSGAGQR